MNSMPLLLGFSKKLSKNLERVKARPSWWLFFGIVAVGSILRFYQLGVVPHGMTWDEAAIGYNGYSVVTTRRDEWLNRLPVSFQSFGDYKAPLAIYVNGLFTTAFGLNLTVVRLPFALAGVGALIGMYLLIRQLWASDPNRHFLAMVAVVVLAFSPWHLHFSRTGFESGLAMSMIVWGLVLLLRWLKKSGRSRWGQIDLVLGSILLALSMYTYHSAKVFLPIFGVFLLIYERRRIASRVRGATASVIITLGLNMLLLFPLIKDSFWGEGLTRISTSLLTSDASVWTKIFETFGNLLTHLSPQFLFLGQTTTLRHSTGGMGVLLPTTGLLVLTSILCLASPTTATARLRQHNFWLGVGWVLIGLLPASIGLEVPHPNRALLALPGFVILAVVGIEVSYERLRVVGSKIVPTKPLILLKSVAGTALMIHLLLAINFTHHYFVNFAAASADDFKDGYIEAFQQAVVYERGSVGQINPGLGKSQQVDKILFTSTYGQPYIYALFVRQTNPIMYQGGSLQKYEFTDRIGPGDLFRQNTLIVATPSDQMPIDRAVSVIYGSDGQIKFELYLTGKGDPE